LLSVPSAWPRFLAGDVAGYIDAIVAGVRAAPSSADVTVLAQASMAPAAERLQDLSVVLSSPGPGVQRIIESMRASTPVSSSPTHGQQHRNQRPHRTRLPPAAVGCCLRG